MLLDYTGLTCICGPIGSGKSSLAAHIATELMIPPLSTEILRLANKEIQSLREGGFEKLFLHETTEHLVYSEHPISAIDCGYSSRISMDLDVSRLRLPEEGKESQFFPPYSSLFIAEAQSKFDSRKSNTKQRIPEGLSRILEVERHNTISIYMDFQVWTTVDIRIRNLATRILHVIDRKTKTVHKKWLDEVSTTWTCLEFSSSQAYEEYLSSGQTKQGKLVEFTHNGDIWKCYSSQAFKAWFYNHMKERNFDQQPSMVYGNNADDMQRFCDLHSFKMPKGYFDDE